MSKKYDALILAGGEISEELRRFGNVSNKALLQVNGKYLIDYVIDALRGVAELDRIAVVGPREMLEPVVGSRVWRIAPPQEGMLDNLRVGIDTLGASDERLLLVVTCDIPLVDADIVGRFFETCGKWESDIYYPVVEKRRNDEKYPKTKRTYARLRDGVYTGGNIVLLRPKIFRDHIHLIEEAIAARKSPLKLARIIGIGFILLLLLRLLTLSRIEKKVEKILGIRAKAVPVEDPEIGIDVDKASDFLLVREILESGG